MSELKQPFMNQVKEIMDENTLDDLKSLLNRRHYLNRCNIALIYLFHLVQSTGILTTTIATGYNYTYLIWVGVGLNIMASLLNAYEKTNANLLKTYLKDIDEIKKGKFTDEGAVEKHEDSPPKTAIEPTNTVITIKPSIVTS